MRVCMFVANPISFDGRVLRHAQTLQDAGHQVTVLGVLGPADRAAPLPPWATFPHQRLDRRKQGLLPRLTWAESALRQRIALRLWQGHGDHPVLAELAVSMSGPELLALALRAGPFDIYHANDLNTLPPARWAARLRSKPFVYDAHELYSEEDGDLTPGERARRLLVERGARAAAAVITVNEALAAEIQALHQLPEPPLVLRNVPPLLAMADPATRPLGSAGTLRLLYHGAHVDLQQPGCDDVLRALQRIRRSNGRVALRYTIRGGLSAAAEAALRARVAELGLTEVVRLCPPVAGATALVAAAVGDEEEVGLAPYLPRSRNFLLATGSKLYEYQNAGMAVVATSLPGNRVAAGEAGVYYPPGDVAALAEILLALAYDRPRLRRLQVLARQRAQRELCWDLEQQRLLGLYQRLAAHLR